MKIYFGKISTKYDTDQIDGGYYQAPKNSTWFNGIEIGAYAFVIGGNKIQLWKAKEWGEMRDGANDKLDFEIIIADTGIETKDLIKPYFTTKEKGTGLGLSIVDKIINDHNGSIKFLNHKNGAKIQIIIPIN